MSLLRVLWGPWVDADHLPVATPDRRALVAVGFPCILSKTLHSPVSAHQDHAAWSLKSDNTTDTEES
jgi:hypothetical protein